MSSYLTSLLTQTSTHYTSLRRLLPNSSSEEADNSISDPSDSHVSRVLRAYYIEKGRPFPAWLGPDPREKEKSTNTMLSAGGSFVGSMRERAGVGGGGGGGTSAAPQRGNGGGGGLGDLFGDTPAAPARDPESLSLRHRPLASSLQSRGSNRGIRSPGLQSTPSSSDSISSQPNARPLPSQRAGSYQARQFISGTDAGTTPSPRPALPRETTSVQERLKARLGGGGGSRGGSPIFGGSASASTSTPPSSSGSGGGYGSTDPRQGNPYESRGPPPPSSNDRNAYDTRNVPSSNDRNPYATTNSSNSSVGRPYMSASSPWMSGDDGYGGGGGGGNRGDYGTDGPAERKRGLLGGRVGLPNGPRPNR
ncbi:hypothetical protein MMC06_000340 [Schaereria dolodes]|nr:hypothetical protein [Schaereria dolodes]